VLRDIFQECNPGLKRDLLYCRVVRTLFTIVTELPWLFVVDEKNGMGRNRNYLEQSSYCAADSNASSLSGIPKVRFRVQNSGPLVPTPPRVTLIQSTPSYQRNIILFVYAYVVQVVSSSAFLVKTLYLQRFFMTYIYNSHNDNMIK